MNNTEFWISDSNNEIYISDNTTTANNVQFAALEGSAIHIGKDCMFSHDIFVRTSDSHSIISESGERINPAKNIVIGNHCWIGMQSLILKGVELGDNSIVAARSTVSKSFNHNTLIGGIPAKELKSNINWNRKRL